MPINLLTEEGFGMIVGSAGASFTGLLDTYGGAAAAYSVRRLSSTYTGALIEVRRSSDNTTQDIGYDANGDLDTAALLSFVGAGDGFVRTWYDQSGNGNNEQQTTTSAQPQIVSSGALITKNSTVAIDFNGSTHIMESTSASEFTGVVNNCIICVLAVDSYGANEYGFGMRSGANGIMLGNSVPDRLRYWLDPSAFDVIDVLTSLTSQRLLLGNFDGSTAKFRINTSETTKSTTAISATPNVYFLGRHTSYNYFDGKIQEAIIYPLSQDSNITSLEDNINTYFSIYP